MPKMEVHPTYPPRPRSTFFARNRQDILRSAFLLAGYASLITNLLLGGMAWSLIVIGGLCVIWIAFVYRPLVENTPIKKLSDTAIVICLYLLLLDALLGQGWGNFVVPIVLFSDLIVIGGFFLLWFDKQKRNFMPLFELIAGGLVPILCALMGLTQMTWPIIVLGAVSLGLLVLSFSIFPRQLMLEVRKKLHR